MSNDRLQYLAAQQGQVSLVSHALPVLARGRVRVRTHYSAVSAGTEMLVLNASKTDDALHPIGYQCSGVVEDVAVDLASHFQPGDRVACYGGPYVGHSAVVDVPANLLVKVPAELSLEWASICGLGAIALHAFRTSGVRIGESVLVVGLGLLGNLIAQLATSAGCRVLGSDLLDSRVKAAVAAGIHATANTNEVLELTKTMTQGHGFDAVFIATGNCSDALLTFAFEKLRHGGTVLMVGTSAASFPREAMFAKEAKMLVPRAAGPGRYDPTYEADGRDYPFSYVRWTEHRNLEEFIRQLSTKRVSMAPLKPEIVPVNNAPEVYFQLAAGTAPLAVIFRWID